MRAGWSSVDITPPLGLPMGGRGPRFAPGARVLDPLQALALILEDDAGERTLWLSVDNIGISVMAGLAWRHELAAITGIREEAILVNFTHTHAGPMINLEGYATLVERTPEMRAYEADLLPRLLRAAVRALAALRPVTATLHEGRSDVGINRRGRSPDSGEVAMRPDPTGHYNSELWALDLRAADAGADGDGHAVLFVHGCHPVIVYGFAWDAISADFPGVARRALAAHLGGPAAHCQFMQSLAGNVRPRVLADPATGAFRKSVPEDVETAGRQLAADVIAALDTPGEALQLELGAAAGSFLARRDPHQIPDLGHWRELTASDDELTHNLARYWVARLEAGVPPVTAMPWPAGLLRLTPERSIAWLGGEAVGEWLPLLRSWLGDAIIPLGYTQSVAAYLPTDELLPQGGYEAARSPRHSRFGPGPFAPGLDAAAADCFTELARRLG